MHMSSLNGNRLDYLDAVRGYALILGVIFHASLSFMPIFIGWAVMDISTSATIPVFALISHSFRMELFFLIAGFFSHMTFHKQGLPSFVKSRLVKLAIPFVLGWLILRPMLVSGWIMGAESMRGDANIGGALVQGITSLSEFPNGFLVGTHLWFLYYLLIISASALLLRYFIGLSQSFKYNLASVADQVVAWLSNNPFATLVVAIPTASCLWFMDGWGMDTPDKSLIPSVPVTVIYGGFFLFGWLLHRQAGLIEHFARLTWTKLALCIVASIFAVKLSGFQGQLAHPQYDLIKVGFLLSYGIVMWSLISLTIGICKRLFIRTSKLIRYVADSAYWLYLIHLPVVICLQIAFAELPLHWSIKLLSICTIAILLSIVLYDALIRSTFVGAILNGKRKPRMLFKRSRAVKYEAPL